MNYYSYVYYVITDIRYENRNNVRTVEGEEVSLYCKYYRMSCDESNWNYR
jgi:hypothetical protein